jgi:aminoglycoside phosphotransferase family enzyme/predicted kinase
MSACESPCQAKVFAFLADPTTHGGVPVRRIDTHAAAVFLAGQRALKVKRAVRYSYLDFSTLEKRKAACAAELDVNRPFAPGLYRGVTAITCEAGGRLAVGGCGGVVEWAVDMRRFDETRTLDRLADGDAGAVDAALADELARTVAVSHARIAAADAVPWIAALSSYIAANDAAFREHLGLFDPAQAGVLAHASRAMLERLRPLLAARGAAGLVRRGHGDLHLGNVALIDGHPVPFDAIEFDTLVATGDVLYDLAFLLMDLMERGLRAAANTVLNRYLAETRRESDLDALAALPLFMSLRAAIRANVTASRLAVVAATERAAAAAAARAYFVLACRLIRPQPPILVGIGGLSGTGKTKLARALAPGLAPPPGAVVLRSDVERKALAGVARGTGVADVAGAADVVGAAGVAETERLPAACYTPQRTAQVYAVLGEKAQRIVAAGHSAVVDAVFAKPEEREGLRAVARAHGVAFRGLFLTADMATRLARVEARQADASDADAAVVRAQETYDLGRNDWTLLDASGTSDETLARAAAALDAESGSSAR